MALRNRSLSASVFAVLAITVLAASSVKAQDEQTHEQQQGQAIKANTTQIKHLGNQVTNLQTRVSKNEEWQRLHDKQHGETVSATPTAPASVVVVPATTGTPRDDLLSPLKGWGWVVAGILAIVWLITLRAKGPLKASEMEKAVKQGVLLALQEQDRFVLDKMNRALQEIRDVASDMPSEDGLELAVSKGFVELHQALELAINNAKSGKEATISDATLRIAFENAVLPLVERFTKVEAKVDSLLDAAGTGKQSVYRKLVDRIKRIVNQRIDQQDADLVEGIGSMVQQYKASTAATP